MKTVNIAESDYDRPEKTYRELLTKKDMAKLLKDYIEEDIEKIPISRHVRYVQIKNGKQQFFTGGTIVFKGKEYVILTNKSLSKGKQSVSWSVQKSVPDNEGGMFDTVFFTRINKLELTMKEDIMALEEKLEEQNELIEQQQKEILKLKKYIKKMKNDAIANAN